MHAHNPLLKTSSVPSLAVCWRVQASPSVQLALDARVHLVPVAQQQEEQERGVRHNGQAPLRPGEQPRNKLPSALADLSMRLPVILPPQRILLRGYLRTQSPACTYSYSH